MEPLVETRFLFLQKALQRWTGLQMPLHVPQRTCCFLGGCQSVFLWFWTADVFEVCRFPFYPQSLTLESGHSTSASQKLDS